MVTKSGRGSLLLPGALLALGLVIVVADGLITLQPQQPQQHRNLPSDQVFKFNYTQRGISSKWPVIPTANGSPATPSPGELILRQHRQLMANLKNRPSVISSINNSTTLNDTTKQSVVTANTTSSGNNKAKNDTLTPLASNGGKPVGRKLSRLQPLSKRQTDGSDLSSGPPSKRNEDPWFLDQPPYPLQPYRFVYNIKGKNGQTEQYRQEVGDGKYLTGSYGYMLPDGIYRHVDYVADDRGFRAFIRTSEPGTANQNPANVVINSNPVVVSPGVDYAFPTSGERPSLYDGRQLLYNSYNNPSTSNFNQNSQTDHSNFANSVPDQPNELRRRPPGSIVNGGLPGTTNFSSLIGSGGAGTSPYTSPLPPGSIVNNALSNFGPLNNNNYNSYLDRTSAKSIVNPLRNFTSLTYAPPTGSIVNNALRNFNSYTFTPTQPPAAINNYFSLGGGSGNEPGSRNASRWSAEDGRSGSGSPPEAVDDNLGLGYKSTGGGDPAPLSSIDLWRRQQEQRQYLDTHGGAGLGLAFNRGSLLQPPTTQAPSIALRRPPISANPSRPSTFDFGSPTSDGSRLSYDRPLADHRQHAGPHKLAYDNNHIFHPDSPYLTLERARNLAHLEQSNGFPRSLTSGGSGGGGLNFGPGLLGTLIPTGPTLTLGGQSQSLRTQTSKDEHHQEHHHSSHSEQVGKGPPVYTVTSREHHNGSKSGSGNEFELKQTISAGGEPLLPPPAPQFENLAPIGTPSSSSQVKSQSTPESDHHLFNIKSGHSGGGLGLSRLQAPYTSSLTPQQAHSFHHHDDHHDSKSPVEPLPPRRPSSPEEPREPAVDVSSTPPTPQLEPPQAADQGADTGAIGEQQRGRPDIKGGGGGLKGGDHRAARQSSVAESSWLGGGGQVAGNVGQPRFVHRPVREPENFRASMMMGDFRSMQNTIGLPQPPRLTGSLADQADERLEGGLNRADRIISARLSQVEALVSGHQTSSGELPLARPQPGGASGASETSESRRNEKPVQASTQVGGKRKQQQRAPEQRLSQAAQEEATDYDRKLSTGPLTRALDGGNLGGQFNDPFNQLLLSGGANETFDARRLSSNAAKLQAERVSELEKFQQRLRTQQLLLATGSGNIAHSSGKTDNQSRQHQKVAVTGSGRARAAGELNSQVKYDEEPDGASVASPHGASDGINRPPRASTSAEVSTQVKAKQVGGNSTNLDVQTSGRPASSLGSALSDLAQRLQAWPSLNQVANNSNNNRTANADQAETANTIDGGNTIIGEKSKPGGRPSGGATSSGGSSQAQAQTKASTSSLAHDAIRNATTKPANTINLDFINSVTALSVDQMNPFAIASVNPALQQQQSRQLLSQATGGRQLSRGGQETGASRATTGGDPADRQNGGSPAGIATSNARYFNSPELLAALDHHERRDTSSQMKSLLPSSSGDGDGHQLGMGGGGSGSMNLQSASGGGRLPSSWASNHRFSGAPYMMLSATSASASHTPAVPPRSSAVAADSVASLSPERSTTSSLDGLQSTSQTAATTTRDGFEVRDRSVQVDNHRFYEVVSSVAPVASNLRALGDGYAAFRDAQLSIPAAS